MDFLVLLVLGFATQAVHSITYTGGVVEFAPNTLKEPLTPEQLILENAQRYEEIIATAAKHGVDIIVFPECGLTSISIPVSREHVLPYLTELPIVGINPCRLPNAPKVLQLLSCAAKTHRMYVVLNLAELAHCSPGDPGCPSDGKLIYNSNLAFDRDGTVVAKYRKFNLFVEPEFNTTETADLSYFDTDFGVRFGMFICFDLLFRDPPLTLLDKYNVSSIVYSTAWFSELPFLSAVSVQAAWAYANDVNFLAAGYSNAPNKNFGSGIFAGVDGTMTAVMPEHSSTRLLIATLSDQRGGTPPTTEEIVFSEDAESEAKFFHNSLANFTSKLVQDKYEHLVYTKDGFTCDIAMELQDVADDVVYRAVAFNGPRQYGNRRVHIEVCGVVACRDLTVGSCGQKFSFGLKSSVFSSISISVSSNNTLISYPITLDKKYLPIPSSNFQYKETNKGDVYEIKMGSKGSVIDLVSFGVLRN